MKEQEVKKIKVSALLDARLPHAEVTKVTKVGIRIAVAKRAGKGHERKPGSGTNCQVSNHTFLESLLERIAENPKMLL